MCGILCPSGDHDDDSPIDENPGDPNPGPDPMQDHVAGNFEDKIAKKENSGDQPEHFTGQSQSFIHIQSGIP